MLIGIDEFAIYRYVGFYTHGESTIDREQSQATACPHGALNETQPGSNALHLNPTHQILIPQHPEVLFQPVTASICYVFILFVSNLSRSIPPSFTSPEKT